MPPEMTPVVGVGAPRGSLVSPTTLTNAIPRPHSPRRPNYRPGEGGGGGGGLLTAESFHRTYRSKIPSIRRRSHQEMGSFDRGGEQKQQQHHVSQPLMCSPIDFLNINEENKNCNTPTTLIQRGFGQSKEYAKRYGPVAQSQLGACVTNTNYVAGQAAGKAGEVTAEFAMTAAEVYRQECKSDNRGEDSMFFQQQSQNELMQEENSLVGNDSSVTSENESERRDSKSTSPLRRKKRRQRRNSNSGSGNSKHSGSRSRSNSRSTRNSRNHRSSNRGQSKFPDAIYMMKVGSNDTRDRSISPPRVDRINATNNTFDPSDYNRGKMSSSTRTGMAPESHGELREARMQLFKMGQNSPSGEMMSDPETRMKLALQDLDRQDGIIDGLKKQLRMNQKSLDEMVEEVKQAKTLAQQKQFKATEAQARSVQERKRLEDMYERELGQNKKLDSMVSTLQVEISSLKVSLRNARSEGKHGPVLSPKNPQSPSPATNPESVQLISLRAEIVDLRSQLAEAKASKIQDSSSLREVEDLKKKLASAEADIRAYKEKAGNLQQVEEKLQKLQEKHVEAETKLEEELKNQKSASEEAKSKLESTLEEARAAEKVATSELAKVKANLQRLEKERSRVRLHSAADVDRVNRQLVKTREETAKFKKQLQDEQASSKTNSTKLKAEMHDLRRKLIQANKNDVSKNAVSSLKESRKLKSDHVKMTQEIKELQKQLKSKEEKIESLTSTVSRMAEKANQVEGLMAQLEETSVINTSEDQDVSLLEAEIDQLKSNEASFRDELKLLTTQLDEARAIAAKNAQDKKEVDFLRKQLEQIKRDPSPVSTPRSMSPILSDLQEEIMSLKQKLSEADAINQGFSSASSEEKSLASIQIKDQPEFVALQEDNTTLKNKLQEVVESKSHAAVILQRENKTLKHLLAQAEEKLQAAFQQAEKAEKPEVRLKAMEQAYLNQISVLKARLAESETKCKDESFRADEERRISRERDSERSQALEKLRQEKEVLDNEKSNLEDTIIELRTKLASTVAAQSGCHFGVSPKPSSDSSEKVADSPKNLKRLRNELALARARLSAARDYSRSIGDISSDSLDTSLDIITTNLEKDIFAKSKPIPSSPDNSVKSQESSWAPPRSTSRSTETPTRRLMDISISSSTNLVPSTSLLSSSLTISSSPPPSEEVSTIKDSFDLSNTQEVDQPIIPPPASAQPETTSPATFPPMRNSVSLNLQEHIDASISHATTPAVRNSSSLKYKEERSAEPEGTSPATTPSITNAVSRNLREQIDASNKRLEAANSRLKNLSERPDFPKKKASPAVRGFFFGQHQEPVEPIVTKDDCRDTSPGCSSNEVSTTPSGNVEVQEVSDHSRSSERMSYFGVREPLQPIVTVESDRRDDGSEGIADEVVATLSGNIEVSHWKYADI